MQHSPPEIKDKLLKALDPEYNVVDMDAVLEIISILEKTPMTKEALESTRLGKHINEFRRKTDNELLAKRAKDLVRRWRDMIMPSSSAISTPPSEPASVNGSGSGTGPGPGGTKQCRSTVTSPAMSTTSSSSPGLSLKRVPSLPSSPTGYAGSSRASPRLPPSHVSHAPNSEVVGRTHANNKRLRKDMENSSPDKEGQPPAKRRATPNGIYSKDNGEECALSASPLVPSVDSVEKSCKSAPVTSIGTTSVPSQTLVFDDNDIVKAKMAQIGRSAKVKTTQELLDDLKARGGSPPPVVNKGSPVRHRTLNSLLSPRSPDDVSKNKTEHIAKFLNSQEDVVNKRPFSPPLDGTSAPEESGMCSPTSKQISEILSSLPPLDRSTIVWSDEEEAERRKKGPNQDSGELLESVVSGAQIEGVTGNYEYRKTDTIELNDSNPRTEFKEWHEHVWRQSSDGQPLLVWPYVIID